jgi:hypothetical protein
MKTQVSALFLFIVIVFGGYKITMGSKITQRNPSSESSSSYFINHVKPIFASRCIGCHACEAAPCQLKLDSYEGVDRGATTAYPKAIKFSTQPQTRIFKDSKTTKGWRKKGFWPVVKHDGNLSKEELLEGSLLYQYMKQGKKQYLSGNLKERTPRKFKQCVKDVNQFHHELVKNKENQPDRGMPFGTPALTDKEFSTIEAWIAMGAPGPSVEEHKKLKTATVATSINEWEDFLNKNDNKNAWTAKYLYEHLFLAHFHFADNHGEFFELQRSEVGTPKGFSNEIVTKFPYNDPGKQFVYRFNKVHSSIVLKTHIVYEVNKKSLERLKEIFIKPTWGNKAITPIDFKVVNPFFNFAQIPAKIRYRFLLENSRLIMDFFTRGPVCSGGKVGTWVLQDHSWALFEDPEYDISVQPGYYQNKKIKKHINVPTMVKKDKLWSYYSRHTRKYEKEHAKLLLKRFPEGRGLEQIWDGDGKNPNALLTLFRHGGYSVSVHHGQIGQVPKTMGLINFAIFERIYYDLVAGFDIYGSFKHKINSRLMITHLRRELEDNFLSLLPADIRREQRKAWYQDKKENNKKYHFDKMKSKFPISNKKSAAKELVVKIINARLSKKVSGPIDSINGHDRLNTSIAMSSEITDEDSLNANLPLIAGVIKGFAQYFPETSYFAFKKGDGEVLYYTVTRSRAHFSVHYLLGEEKVLDKANDTIHIKKDFPLSFPQQFFEIDMKDAQSFIDQISYIRSLEAYKELENKYGIPKGDIRFWKFYDALNAHIRELDPINAGVLDINRYGFHHFPEFKF